MKKLMALTLAGALVACSDGGGVDPDAIDEAEIIAVRGALDSAFLNDTVLDPAFTGDSGLYALMSALVFPFIDRASRIAPASGADTTRVVGIEFDINATQGDSQIVSNLTGILAWKGFDTTTATVDSVYFILGSGRAPVTDSLWERFTLDTAGTGTGFVIHQFADFSVSKWLSRGGHLRTTSSQYGSSQGNSILRVFKGTLSGEYTISAKSVPDSTTTVTSLLDFGSGSHAIKVQIHGSLP
jgi:hypothetical protein